MGRLRGRCRGQTIPSTFWKGLVSAAEASPGHLEPSRASVDFTPDGHVQAWLLPVTQVDAAEFPGRHVREALSGGPGH